MKNIKTTLKYIANHLKEDKMHDDLSGKEYIALFTLVYL